MTLGDRIAVMSAGHLQQVDTPMGLYERPANLFVAGFIGSPPMNLISGMVEVGQGGRVFRSANGDVALPLADSSGIPSGTAVTLGLRPEALALEGADAPIQGRVDLVEPLGSETLVHVDVGQATLVARFAGDVPPKAGDAAGLEPDLGGAHWFGEDGRRVGGGPEPGES